ncbi:MAG: class I SAM-dependent methyltransferase [Pseudomonadota bacterium]
MSLSECPISATSTLEPVFDMRDVPVICNQLWPDRDSAKTAPVADIDLVVCTETGLVFNRAFDAAILDYGPGYENALHFSPKFQAFADALVAGLVERHGLKGRDVIEIGCGDGHILSLMAQHGVRRATGFDPTMAGVETPFTAAENVTIEPAYFTAAHLNTPFDAILCRHVLEHLSAPMDLLTEIRRAVGDRPVPVYFEVPNAGWMLDTVSMWDVIYEHVTYWTADSAEALFRRAGFRPTSIREGYGGQFLMIEAMPAAPQPGWVSPTLDRTLAAARSFGAKSNAELDGWRDKLRASTGGVAIWGAGSKGITFANALGVDGARLRVLVDVNTRKHGKYVPGVGLPVVAPADLSKHGVDLVLISNSRYEDEIRRSVQEMALYPDFGLIAG